MLPRAPEAMSAPRISKNCIEKYNDCFYGDGVQVAAYFNFTPAEVEHVAKLMPPTKDFGGMPGELLDQAKANHPTTPSSERGKPRH
jgi:hypothetical protein